MARVVYKIKLKEGIEKVDIVVDTMREAIAKMAEIPEAERIELVYPEHFVNPFRREGLYE